MRNVSKVIQFEFKSILMRKTVLVSTLIIALLVFSATFIPRVIGMFSNGEERTQIITPVDDHDEVPNGTRHLMDFAAIVFQTNEVSLEQLSPFIENIVVVESQQQLQEKVKTGEYLTGFVLTGSTSFEFLAYQSRYSWDHHAFSDVLFQIQVSRNMIDLNVDQSMIDQVNEVHNIVISHETTILNVSNASQNSFILTNLLLLAVYMMVIMYGTMVATTVAREKDNRTMELLITSTTPTSLIVGKVLGSGAASVVQFSTIILAGALGIFINLQSFQEFAFLVEQGLTWDTLVVFVLFTLTGYLLYLFIFASLGSLVSKVEDVNSTVTPIMMLFIVAYFIASIGMELPESGILRVASLVPFTSILNMPIRYALSTVSAVEVAIGLVLMVLVTLFFAFLSIRIYRLGSLNYGKKLGFFSAMRMVMTTKID